MDELLVERVFYSRFGSKELYSSILLRFMMLMCLVFLTKNAGTLGFFY
jgi:hypothetical protein